MALCCLLLAFGRGHSSEFILSCFIRRKAIYLQVTYRFNFSILGSYGPGGKQM